MGREVHGVPGRVGGLSVCWPVWSMLGRVCEAEGLDLLREGGAVVRRLPVVGVVRVEAGRRSAGGRVVPESPVLLLRPESQRAVERRISFRKLLTCLDSAWGGRERHCFSGHRIQQLHLPACWSCCRGGPGWRPSPEGEPGPFPARCRGWGRAPGRGREGRPRLGREGVKGRLEEEISNMRQPLIFVWYDG